VVGLGIVWALSAVEDIAGSSFGGDHTEKEVSSDCPWAVRRSSEPLGRCGRLTNMLRLLLNIMIYRKVLARNTAT
jgi:hypothetical protein